MRSNFMKDQNHLLGISGAFFLKFNRKTEAPTSDRFQYPLKRKIAASKHPFTFHSAIAFPFRLPPFKI